jgi:hypothetical protein
MDCTLCQEIVAFSEVWGNMTQVHYPVVLLYTYTVVQSLYTCTVEPDTSLAKVEV